MFTDGDLAYARAIREQVETGHAPAFTMLPYLWQLMLGAVTSEVYLPGATRAIIGQLRPRMRAHTFAIVTGELNELLATTS
jgi:hypothetical protein